MRVLLFCLCLGSLTGCARDDVPLGTEGEDTGGGTNTGNGSTGEDKDSGPDDNNTSNTGDNGSNGTGNASNGNATSGGEPDAGGSTGEECTPAMCSAPMDAGEIESDVDGSPVMVQGMGHAFVKVSAIDGQSTGNSAGGVRATLTSSGGNYDLFAYGGPNDACTSLSISSANPAGQSDSVAPIWGVNGPVVFVDWELTFEVRPADGMCDAPWTLTLQGNPCEMPFATSVPKQCP